MMAWRALVGPLGIWVAHFMILWGASSIAPDSPGARLAGAAATLIALVLLAWLTRRTAALPRQDDTTRWIRTTGLLASAVAAISIAWQAMPALLG